MAVGKSSVKRAQFASETGKKEKAAPEAAKEEKTMKKPEERLTVSQSEGVNAHYGINTPLPTFLL